MNNRENNERKIIKRLAKGMTITQTIKDLKISKGTVHKYLSDLRLVNGCKTNYQLMYKAGKEGREGE